MRAETQQFLHSKKRIPWKVFLGHASIGLCSLAFILPFYWLFVSAFKSQEEIFSIPPIFWPSNWSLVNFREAFQTTPILKSFVNSTVIAVGHCCLSVVLCAMGGYAFSKFPRAPGFGSLFAFLMGTMIIPDSVSLIPSFLVMVQLDFVNTYWSLILPGAASAFGIFWMRQYIGSNVPDSVLEAARIDGSGELRIFFTIVLPIVKPALAALFVLRLMSSWNNLMWAFVMLRTEDSQTMPVLVYLLQGDNQTPYGMLMAASLLITLPLVLAFLLLQRYFVEGITAGAVKG